MPDKRIRVLLAKPGLDGHDRGAPVASAKRRSHDNLRSVPAIDDDLAASFEIERQSAATFRWSRELKSRVRPSALIRIAGKRR